MTQQFLRLRMQNFQGTGFTYREILKSALVYLNENGL